MAGKASGLKFKFLFFLGLSFLILLSIHPAFSDTIDRIYDNLGRLVMVVSSSGAMIVYGYDEAGNLVSETRTTVNNQPPVLTGITPNQTFTGNEVSINITGSNLLATKSVTSSNSGIDIKNFSSTNNSVSIDAIISKTAATGPADFTVVTLSGSASISMDLLNLTFSPAQIAITNGASASITARMDGLTSDYDLSLNNENPDTISAPRSLTVPVSGSVTFNVTGLANGAGVIAAGNSALSVYVSAPFSGSGTACSAPVSVFVATDLRQNGSVTSASVSAWVHSYINGIFASTVVSVQAGNYINGMFVSPSVSVAAGSYINGTFVSPAASVGAESYINGMFVAPLVSVQVSQ